MKDRDKRILLILLILAVALLPYFLYIKQTKVETENIKNEIVKLDARYKELQAMNAHREEYIAKTKEYNEKMMAIINKFPADVLPENYVMFLLATELHTTKYDEENDQVVVEKPILFDSYEMTVNTETPIQAEDVSTNSAAIATLDEVTTEFIGKTNISNISFRTYYDGFKDIIQYFIDCEDPMIYRDLNVSYDKNTGVLSGKISLAQYAISGPDRVLDKPEFTFEYDGVEEVFDYGLDNNNLRGNRKEDSTEELMKYGLFGPVESEPILDEEELQKMLEEMGMLDEAGVEGAEGNDDAAAEEGNETGEAPADDAGAEE